MKTAVVILSVLAMSGQGMSFTIDEVAGTFTATTANAAELLSGVMAFLHYPQADIAKAKEYKDPITLSLKVLKNSGPDYSIEIENHNPIAEPKPLALTAGKQTSNKRIDGKPYIIDLVAKDKNSIVITGTMESGCNCALTYDISKDGAHVAYHCSSKHGGTYDTAIDYKRN